MRHFYLFLVFVFLPSFAFADMVIVPNTPATSYPPLTFVLATDSFDLSLSTDCFTSFKADGTHFQDYCGSLTNFHIQDLNGGELADLHVVWVSNNTTADADGYPAVLSDGSTYLGTDILICYIVCTGGGGGGTTTPPFLLTATPLMQEGGLSPLHNETLAMVMAVLSATLTLYMVSFTINKIRK